MRRASSIVRKHRAADRVYIPSSARDNQYILAELPLTDRLLNLVVGDIDLNASRPYQKFYQKLAHTAFEIIEKHGLAHANFVANNRLVRVRYSDEQQVLHTEQQSFFFYSPKHNSSFKGYFDGALRARKVKLLFLAKGDELRLNSATFHQKVALAVNEIIETVGLDKGEVKLRDHQHLTFDVFAQEKGHKETVTHSFKDIATRYQQQGFVLEPEHTSINYAIVSVPMARRLLKGADIDYNSDEPFVELYRKIEQSFARAADENQVKHSAMIANGLSPFVRYDEQAQSLVQGELISLGFNPKTAQGSFISHWQGDKLTDTVRFVFFADSKDEAHHTYGKFANQVLDTIKDFASQMNWKTEQDGIIMRMHQHIMRQI